MPTLKTKRQGKVKPIRRKSSFREATRTLTNHGAAANVGVNAIAKLINLQMEQLLATVV